MSSTNVQIQNTFSYRLFGKLLLSWTNQQKTNLFTKLLFVDLTIYLVWAAIVFLYPHSEQYVQLNQLKTLTIGLMVCAVVTAILIAWQTKKKTHKNTDKQFAPQLSLMLFYSGIIHFIGYFFAQSSFVTGVSIGSVCFWSVLLLERRVAYVCFIVNLTLLFGSMFYFSNFDNSYAAIYTSYDIFNSAFWTISFFILGVSKITLIMLLGDAVINIFRERHTRLLYLSNHDTLTGLLSRRHIQSELTRELVENTQLSIMIIDIDHFKSINDNYGHLTGDAVIHKVAKTLQENVRAEDYVGRFGGEEFLIAMTETDIYQTQINAKMLLDKIRNTVVKDISGNDLSVTISIGIACSFGYFDSDKALSGLKISEKEASNALQKLMSDADEALLQAKENGRDQYITAKIITSIH